MQASVRTTHSSQPNRSYFTSLSMNVQWKQWVKNEIDES